MADVSKFTMPDGQTYNVKDATARTDANQAKSDAGQAKTDAEQAKRDAGSALTKVNECLTASYSDETITFTKVGGGG